MKVSKKDYLKKLSETECKKVSTLIPDKRFGLHAMIRDCGHSVEHSHSYHFDNMFRGKSGFAVLQLTLAGEGCLEEEKRIRSLTAGTLMVVTVPGRHSYYLPEHSHEWDFIFFVVYGMEALRIITGIERVMGTVICLKKDSPVINTMANALTYFLSRERKNAFDNSRFAYEICMNLGKECFLHPEMGYDPRFMEVKQFIKDNISRDVSVSEMAEIVGLSRSYFTRLFRIIEGITPNTYLENYRLKTAIQLLRAGDLSVAETAFSCGYYDVNYFCRIFKKRMAITPGDFKKYSCRSTDPSRKAQ